MHLSMHNWMRSKPLEATLERLARFGYERIEISGEPERYPAGEVRSGGEDGGDAAAVDQLISPTKVGD